MAKEKYIKGKHDDAAHDFGIYSTKEIEENDKVQDLI